ncbi:MAG TPA: glycoside hydrolase family 15 protein, partial [Mycobacterium sp.]|nr:glycoside hydrolase family 15 protein [Mycobacterium sp.]
GLWELDPHWWTHSRLIAAAGLRAAAASLPNSSVTTGWIALADHITAEASRSCLRPDGCWARASDDQRLDAALLLPGLRGAVPADDARSVATLDKYLDELTERGYAYRFRHDNRALPAAEGSFLLCGFLTALALRAAQRPVEAHRWFERTNAACGPAQLFSEEYDAEQHQMRGNLPQAFVHALMIETAARLNQEVASATDPCS